MIADIGAVTRRVIGIAALLAVAGCNQAGNGSTASPTPQAAVSSPEPAPLATPSPTPTVDLARYAGKYPFDKVGGMTFLANPAVVDAVDALVGDAHIRALVLGGDGPGTPIARRAGKLIAWGCETHNCGDHEWSVLIAPDGAGAQICYHDASTTGDRSRWYTGAGRADMRDGSCPST